jgi:uncharacterized protein YbdZ (MbtH family)
MCPLCMLTVGSAAQRRQMVISRTTPMCCRGGNEGGISFEAVPNVRAPIGAQRSHFTRKVVICVLFRVCPDSPAERRASRPPLLTPRLLRPPSLTAVSSARVVLSSRLEPSGPAVRELPGFKPGQWGTFRSAGHRGFKASILLGSNVTTNPFNDENGSFFVLVNEQEQHSLWPTFAKVPAGWRVVYDEADRAACLGHIESNWADIRPKSLRDRLVEAHRA